ncbi:RecF/RecN/SMC protein [Polyplosphaeria fusca]|uniref:Structural maintenance of chromosomes protein n=1 Tax=Polyplosphaeria fusca TaxID=682080 RepID=A0A9P4QJK4_9PLEO|nr:RecF/RecN/SMC protein [Polyplosphaeria fusca]
MGFIKQITIHGFKSYNKQTGIENFSPKSNIIVGRNGSGKSNFFAAVRFVLGDDYSNLSREQRQALLHEGSGSAVMSAFVEVCFDNSDERFPTGKPELYLRRTIGVKKDEYSIDRKNSTKQEVVQLLESAGLSRENPYFIVPQGRITEITSMSDSKRLQLLKDISGSKMYEDKRKESVKIIADTDNKRAKIDGLVSSIEGRLDELRGEKEELEAYHNKDRERRGLRYAIERQRETQLEQQIAEIDERRDSGEQDNNERMEDFIAKEQEMEIISKDIGELDIEHARLAEEREQLETDRTAAARTRAQFDLQVTQLSEGQSAASKTQKRREAELRDVQQKVKAREDELAELDPEFDSKAQEENEVAAQLRDAESQRKRLEDKQGRSAVYSNKRQRDDALRAEVDSISQAMMTQKAVLMDTNEGMASLDGDIKRLQSIAADLQSRVDGQDGNTKTIEAQLEMARDARVELENKKKELYREDNSLKSQFDVASRQFDKTYTDASPDFMTRRGLETLRRLESQKAISGIHGIVGDLFDVGDKYLVAAERCLGNKMFHVVVDDDRVASRAIALLNKEKGGRLTFIPMERLEGRQRPQYPKANDVLPLIEKIQYDQQYEAVMLSIFGNCILVPSLQTGGIYARTHELMAMTIDGDSSDKKGRMTGGYTDTSKSKLKAFKLSNAARAEKDTLESRRREGERKIQTLEQQITGAYDEVLKLERQRNQARGGFNPTADELRRVKIELEKKEDSLKDKRRTVEQLSSTINELGGQQSDLEAELASDFKKALSDREERELHDLATTVKNLRREVSKLTAERADLETQKSAIELELRENLRPSLEQLVAQVGPTGRDAGESGRLRDARRAFERYDKSVQDLDAQMTEIDTQLEQANNERRKLQASLDEKKRTNTELSKAIEKQLKRMDRGLKEKQTAQENLKEVQQAIRELGTLPDDVWQKFANQNIDKLSARLEKVNGSLKKYSGINKKAFEQFENFTKSRRMLVERRDELNASRNSIENLIDALDARKDEAIQRTFKQVSKAFSEIFVQLVPAGIGHLVIQRKSDREAYGEDDSEEEEEQPAARSGRRGQGSVENYAGVGIKVSFNSKHDEQQKISQLSGGQKSLCALALVFAIQQCDPAPFYLFDEIDANLDAAYRTAVAKMLEKLAGKGGGGPKRGTKRTRDGEEHGEDEEDVENGGGQFIITTFRPELVHVADKCYGVNYSNKTSTIDAVAKKDALEFVEGNINAK